MMFYVFKKKNNCVNILLVHIPDYDECVAQLCDSNADCINTVGSYSCQCRNGYTGDGNTCTGRCTSFHMLKPASTMQYYLINSFY